MKYLFPVFAFLLTSFAHAQSGSAQDSPAWRAVLLHSDAGVHELVVVTDSGIGQPIPLAEDFAIGLDAPKLSPDGRFAVTSRRRATRFKSPTCKPEPAAKRSNSPTTPRLRRRLPGSAPTANRSPSPTSSTSRTRRSWSRSTSTPARPRATMPCRASA